MTVDPRWCFFMTLFISILNFIIGSTSQVTALGLTQHEVTVTMAAMALVAGILGIVNTALAAIPSKDSKTGFYLAPKDTPK